MPSGPERLREPEAPGSKHVESCRSSSYSKTDRERATETKTDLRHDPKSCTIEELHHYGQVASLVNAGPNACGGGVRSDPTPRARASRRCPRGGRRARARSPPEGRRRP